MYKITLSFFACFFFQFMLSQENDNQAPVVQLDVQFNGESYQIIDGESISINGTDVTITTSDYLNFDFGTLKFQYPKHFAYEYESDFAYQNWTLDGNNFVILYFEYGMETGINEFIGALVDKFGENNCTVTDSEIELGNINYTGKSILVNLVGVKLTYDMYKLPTEDGKSHFIAFQDSKNDDGSDSVEGQETLEVIKRTFKIE